MLPTRVVVVMPLLDHDLGCSARPKPFEPQTPVAEFATESSFAPFCHCLPRSLRAVSMPCPSLEQARDQETPAGDRRAFSTYSSGNQSASVSSPICCCRPMNCARRPAKGGRSARAGLTSSIEHLRRSTRCGTCTSTSRRSCRNRRAGDGRSHSRKSDGSRSDGCACRAPFGSTRQETEPGA